jgi:long-chain acyl-CoA synthetase
VDHHTEALPGPRRSLLEFFDEYIRGRAVGLVYDDGYRTWAYTSAQIRSASEALADRLTAAGLRPADRIVIWSENRPEWIIAFWAALLRGIVAVPIDAGASADLVRRIAGAARPRAIFVGDDVRPAGLPETIELWRLRDVEWPAPRDASGSPATPSPPHPDVGPDTVAEIVFTSGTTGEPKGVVITHGNILANIAPIEREALAYRPWLRFIQPIRFLNLLPLSHMFGQALAIFLPPVIPAAVLFMRGQNPDEVVAQIRRRRVILLIAVPRMLQLFRDRVIRLAPDCATPGPARGHWIRRRWRYRRAHGMFGLKFCGFVVGAAQLDFEMEEWWRRLGFAVVQGYGLTETAPMVAWNNPFHTKKGTVGAPLAGVDVRLAEDGEILVRGPNVAPGYFEASGRIRPMLEEGWFHTGDVGVFDQGGNLVIRGRKKDVIVTPEGLNVFPEDVERVLDATPGVRESAVIGRSADGAEYVHAVLVLRPDADPSAVLREANARLETHQRIRDYSIWPGAALPRTEAIRKLKRHEIRQWAAGEKPPLPAQEAGTLSPLLASYVGTRRVRPDATLDELGMTSLDRLELLSAIEERIGATLDESVVAEPHTVAELQQIVDRAAENPTAPERLVFPAWSRVWPARFVRNLSQTTWILPIAQLFMRIRVVGREHLEDVSGPVIFAANHQSHFDTPAVLAALPARWRRLLAVPAAKEFFDPHFFPASHGLGERLLNSGLYYLAALFFNAFPLPRTGPGTRDTVRYIGDLIERRQSILIFPEGHRSDRGEVGRFQPGVGVLASRLRVPVVPVHLEGVHRVLHRTWRWPRRDTVTVTFGRPMVLEGADYAALAKEVERAVAALEPARAGRPRIPGAA